MSRGGGQETLRLFASFVKRTMGLYFPAERLPELAQKMAAVGRRAGCSDPEKYLLGLMTTPLSSEKSEELAAALTIGETYFLRDPKSYRLFSEELLPALVAARRGGPKRLRIWSAGCSSGEEPYSIAILLARTLPDLADWEITLLGTDLNPQALERAREGVYRPWSFRNAPPWLREYFRQDEDGRYRIVPRIREMVRFEELNLADGRAFQRAGIGQGWDVIFCRNVLLYFDAKLIEQTVARFQAALADGGWLLVGPTEIDHAKVKGFACHHHEGAFVLQKAETAQPLTLRSIPAAPAGKTALAPAKSQPVPATSAPPAPFAPAESSPAGDSAARSAAQPGEELFAEALALYLKGHYRQAAELARSAAGEKWGEAFSLAARSYANIGSFPEARDCCEQAIACDRLKAGNHYLLSLILEQQGESEAAIRSLRDALFIDHDFLLAHFALGNLNRERGERREAERNFGNALRLLERRHPQEALPEAEGMTAGSLAQIIRGMLSQSGDSLGR